MNNLSCGKSDVNAFLRRARSLYPYLNIETDEQYFKLVGMAKNGYRGWYLYGIRRVQIFVLDLLEECSSLKKENIRLMEIINKNSRL